MKTKTALIVSLLALFVLLFLWQRQLVNHQVFPQPQESESGVSSVPTRERGRVPGQATAGEQTSSPTPVAKPEANSSYQQLLAEWQAPIEFYGRVLDEKSNAIAGASVRFSWTETPEESGERTSQTESDSQGFFSLHGKRGSTLQVWVSKLGYYAPKPGFRGFSYSLSAHFSADPMKPVIFPLRSRGEAVDLVHVRRNYSVPRDGTPVGIDLISGNLATRETANLIVECMTEDQGKRPGQRYNWRCRVVIPGGGIVTTDEEFAFSAPEGGYVASAEVKMSADRLDWKDDVDLKFFYRLVDGRYGRMTFSMVAFGQHFCMIDSFVNPTGSRNLEPAN